MATPKVRRFVLLAEGPTPAEAVTIFASGDPRLVQEVVRVMGDRLIAVVPQRLGARGDHVLRRGDDE